MPTSKFERSVKEVVIPTSPITELVILRSVTIPLLIYAVPP